LEQEFKMTRSLARDQDPDHLEEAPDITAENIADAVRGALANLDVEESAKLLAYLIDIVDGENPVREPLDTNEARLLAGDSARSFARRFPDAARTVVDNFGAPVPYALRQRLDRAQDPGRPALSFAERFPGATRIRNL
jgi:hypothetical protein